MAAGSGQLEAREFHPRGDAEFREHLVQVILHCAPAEKYGGGDLGV
jgi:hypothetical protein